MEQGLAFWAAVLTIAGLLATSYMVDYRKCTEIGETHVPIVGCK